MPGVLSTTSFEVAITALSMLVALVDLLDIVSRTIVCDESCNGPI